jgi:glycyl-tRNA synthetase beta chain
MKEHQRYFPLEDDRGALLPYFVCISNTDPKDRTLVVKGNERVLKARLSDADFFFQDDLKIPLEKRLEALKKVVFQAKLGTSFEKVMRFTKLALLNCEQVEQT